MATEKPPSAISRPRRRSIVVVGIAGGALASVILLLQVIPYGLSRSLTPIDEIGHIDYAIAMSVGHWPRWGDTYAQQTLLIADCVGSGFGPSGSCHPHERQAEDYFPEGWSYEAQQPPLGYVAHGVVARATGLSEPLIQLSWLRATSLFLGVFGLLAIGALAGAVAPTARVAFAAATSAALMPTVVNASQFVTNDAALLIAGSLAVVPGLVVIMRPQTTGRVVYPLAVACGIAVPLIKTVASVTIVAMLLWAALLAVPWGTKRVTMSRRALYTTGVQLAVAGGTTLAFVITQQALGSMPSRVVMDAVLGRGDGGFPWTPLAIGVRDALSMALYPYEPVTEFRVAPVALLIGGLLVALLVLSSIPGPESLRRLDPVPVAIVGAVVVTMAVWTFGMYFWGGFGLSLPLRFLIPLVPLVVLLSLKGLARISWVSWTVPVVGFLLALAMVSPIIPPWLGTE